MPPKSQFVEGEKVLCYHGHLLYEAKCLRVEYKENAFKYYVHYSGWNKKWDEWVLESRILTINDTNLLKQVELQKLHVKDKKSKAKTAIKKVEKEATTPQTPPQEKVPRGKAKASSQVLKQEVKPLNPTSPPPPSPPPKTIQPSEESFMEDIRVENDVVVKLSPFLCQLIIDDWDLVMHQYKLLTLPARFTVDHIIASYVKEKVSVKGTSKFKENTIVYVTNQIRDCFNVLLGKQLLYKFERPQYAEIIIKHKGTSMCQIYGSVHLLRMFTKLGDLLSPLQSSKKISEKSMESLVSYLDDFADYLSNNESFFNINDYYAASPEYLRMASIV